MLRGRAAWIPDGRGRRDRPRCPRRASCHRGITGKNSATQQAARQRTLVAAYQSIDRTCVRLTTPKACPCVALVSSSDGRIFARWFPALPPPLCRQGDCMWHGAPSPSPRLRGEGRGEGASPQAQTRGDAPSPGMSAKDALIPTSPRKRGEVKAVPHAIALRQQGWGEEVEAQEKEPPFWAAPSHNREASNRVDRSHSVSKEWTFKE